MMLRPYIVNIVFTFFQDDLALLLAYGKAHDEICEI